jgi:hypoxanthine phosphoribosyltransferase
MSYLPHPEPTKLREAVARIILALTPVETEFDAVLCTGLSGIVPSAIYCYMTGKRLVVLRRPNEGSHGQWLEGSVYDTNYVIVDDFVATGDTLKRLLSISENFDNPRPKYLVLYGGNTAQAPGEPWFHNSVHGYSIKKTAHKHLFRIEKEMTNEESSRQA